MSEFVILNSSFSDKEKDLSESFSSIGISKNEIDFFSNDFYFFAFNLREVDYHYNKNNNEFVFLIGTCLYKDEVFDLRSFNFEEFRDNACLLTGRFQIISIKGKELTIINSLFGTLPCYEVVTDDFFAFSSSCYLLKSFLDLELDEFSIKQKALYFCNYGTSLLKGVKRIEPASITFFKDKIAERKTYLTEAISIYKADDVSDITKLMSERIDKLIISYSKKYPKLSLSFSGGRDSRFLACKILQNIDKGNLELLTVGDENDVEYRLARKFSDKKSLKHLLFRPRAILDKDLLDYSRYYGVLNFPVQYQVQLEEFLKSDRNNFINSIIPETIFSHMSYFEGKDHYAINFCRNRTTVLEPSNVKDGSDVVFLTEKKAVMIWENLRSSLPNSLITNVFFENSTYQADWVYSTLRTFDRTGKVICFLEDPYILSLISSLPYECLLGDELYETLIETACPELNEDITTRQLTFSGIKGMSNATFLKNFKEVFYSLKNNSSLGYLTKKNQIRMKEYIHSKEPFLNLIFEKNYVDFYINRIENLEFSNNRIWNYYCRRFSKKYLDEYEIIIPFCVLGILNEYSK